MGLEEMACPDEPQKCLTSLAKSLNPPLSTSNPKTPRTPGEKAPKQTQNLVRKFL